MLRPLFRDGPGSYARFVSVTDVRYNSGGDGWAAVDAGRLRVFAGGAVSTVLEDIVNAVGVSVAQQYTV